MREVYWFSSLIDHFLRLNSTLVVLLNDTEIFPTRGLDKWNFRIGFNQVQRPKIVSSFCIKGGVLCCAELIESHSHITIDRLLLVYQLIEWFWCNFRSGATRAYGYEPLDGYESNFAAMTVQLDMNYKQYWRN